MINKKFLFLVALFFLLALIVWFFLTRQDVTTAVIRNEVDTLKPQVKVEEISQTRRTSPEFVADDMDDDTQQDNAEEELEKQKNLQMNQDVAQIFELVKQHKYSSDPLIEFISLFLEHEECNVSKIKIENLSSVSVKSQLGKQWQNYCQQDAEVSDLFRRYRSSSSIKKLLATNQLESDFSTEFLHIVQQSSSRDKSNDLFNFIMQTKSYQFFKIINKPQRVKVFADAIKNNINTLNSNYLTLIAKESLYHYSCQVQKSIACLSTGEFMLNKCKEDPLLCGKDGDYWFNHYIYAGHRADIQRVVRVLDNW